MPSAEERLLYLEWLLRRRRIPRRSLLQYLTAERGLKIERLENLLPEQVNRLIAELHDRRRREALLERVLTIDMEPLFPELSSKGSSLRAPRNGRSPIYSSPTAKPSAGRELPLALDASCSTLAP